MQNSVSAPALDPKTVSSVTNGVIDAFDYVDGVGGLFPRVGAPRVPRGAPLVISGWAVDPSSEEPPRAVAIVLDAVAVGTAETGLSRYDVKALLGPATPEFIGFRALVPTDHLSPGDHFLAVYALGADGAWHEAASLRFRLLARLLPELSPRPARPRMNIDLISAVGPGGERGPLPGVVPHGQFALVCGWAADMETRTPAAGVCAIDADGGRWMAGCDVARPDVRAAVGGADDRYGFEIAVPTDRRPPGKHTVEVWAFDAHGRRLGAPEIVEFQVALPIRLFSPFADVLEEPAAARVSVRVCGPGAGGERTTLRSDRELEVMRGDVLELEGWAVLPDGSGAAELTLEMHPLDMAVPPARYHPVAGYRREKPPRELATPPRDDAWFSYRLGTQLLSPFCYRLMIAVGAEGGETFARAELATLRVLDPDADALPNDAARRGP